MSSKGFFGTLLSEETYEGLFLLDRKVNYGVFKVTDLDFEHPIFLQGFSYDLETSTEEQIGDLYESHVERMVFYKAYLNFKEDKKKPVVGFDCFDNYCPEPISYAAIIEDESIQNKISLSRRSSSDWSDDEETKGIRYWVKTKTCKN